MMKGLYRAARGEEITMSGGQAFKSRVRWTGC